MKEKQKARRINNPNFSNVDHHCTNTVFTAVDCALFSNQRKQIHSIHSHSSPEEQTHPVILTKAHKVPKVKGGIQGERNDGGEIVLQHSLTCSKSPELHTHHKTGAPHRTRPRSKNSLDR